MWVSYVKFDHGDHCCGRVLAVDQQEAVVQRHADACLATAPEEGLPFTVEIMEVDEYLYPAGTHFTVPKEGALN